MDVRALVYAPEPETVLALRRAFGVVGLDLEVAADVPATFERFRQDHFDCVVLDCECAPVDTLSHLRFDPIGRTMPIFALVGNRHSMRKAYEDGATFTLDKPLSYDRTLRCMRAAYGLVVGQRRRYQRHPLEIPVMLKISGVGDESAVMVNLSSGGMCLRVSRSLPEMCRAKVSFNLPDLNEPFRANCELAWSKGERAGFKFTSVASRARDVLGQWLLLQSEGTASTNNLA